MPASGPGPGKADPRQVEKVQAIFTSLAKYINAKTIYTSNNPNVVNFGRAFNEAVRAFFEKDKELVLTIEQYQIKWHDEVVYHNTKKTESLAFLLFKDGIGEISFATTVKLEELDKFVDLVRNEIYNPSAQLDFVSRMWQAEFVDISYRVYDECSDGAAGAGRGTGAETREQLMRANDHTQISRDGQVDTPRRIADEESFPSLGAYFHGMVERTHADASPVEKERRLQGILEPFYTIRPDELHAWRGDAQSQGGGNKLLRFLDCMLDFTERRSPPAVARDVLDIIERLVRYGTEEADIETLLALLEVQNRLAGSGKTAVDFQTLPGRMKEQLTNQTFLLSLGKTSGRSPEDVRGRLRYFEAIGREALPGLCELLAHLDDPAMHRETCDVLGAIAGPDVVRIVGELNLGNPREARDAVYLVRRAGMREAPPVIEKLASSPDVQVRGDVIEYLAGLGTDQAARLLCALLDDGNAGVRMQAYAAAESLAHPMLTDRIVERCFAEDGAARSMDELERLFRAAGKLIGEEALGPVGQMARARSWLPSGRIRARQSKLLAVTALRYIPGRRSLEMLGKLAKDRDHLVRTKAQYVLKQLETKGDGGDGRREPVREAKSA